MGLAVVVVNQLVPLGGHFGDGLKHKTLVPSYHLPGLMGRLSHIGALEGVTSSVDLLRLDSLGRILGAIWLSMVLRNLFCCSKCKDAFDGPEFDPIGDVKFLLLT